jgi:hypothetical protein
MKKFLLLLVLLHCNVFSYTQISNVILYTDNNEKFTVILNGIIQNTTPESNIKITSLQAEYYKLKIKFENLAIGEKNFNLAVEVGSESTYSIKKNSKGEYVLRLVNTVPIKSNTSTQANQVVVVYSENPSALPIQDNNKSIENTNENPVMPKANYDSQETISPNTEHVKGYSGLIGCSTPMIDSDFLDFKKAIQAKSFEDAKMNVAKQGIVNQCFLVSQIRDLIQLFSFEETKLDIAKYAYNFTYDQGNYSKLNDSFTFENSIEELNLFIQSKK